MLKKIAGLIIITLIISIGGVSASLEKEITQPSFKDMLAETTETPIPRIISSTANNSIEIIISYVQENINGNLSQPEVNCLLRYYYEQLNTDTTFNLELYADYLNDSTEHPIKGVELTAKELYNQAPGAHDFIDKMDGLTHKYSTLTHDEKVEFLMNQVGTDELTANILDAASVDEILFMEKDGVFDKLSELPDYEEGSANIIGAAQNYQDAVEKSLKNFNHAVLQSDLSFEVYGKPSSVGETVSLNDTINKLSGVQGKINTSKDKVTTLGWGLLSGSFILLLIGGTMEGMSSNGGRKGIMYYNKIAETTFSIVNPVNFIKGVQYYVMDSDEYHAEPTYSKVNVGKSNVVVQIIGGIIIAIGLAMLAVAIWVLVFGYVTLDALITRVQRIIDLLIRNNPC